ncbi:MAG: hypothetical protein OYL92_10685 [Acidobacteriota bacterium]|nr:hypothetical protein [Acidobacteriota bacterium]MDE2921389.1 hypothetical protein [Acidobacteriota bacterium]MDE3265422.1 hypothetical protein [Acidobacteriota bacterium]
MSYPAIPLNRILQDTVIGWTVYACLVVVAAAVAIYEHRERRRLERDLTVARQLPALPRTWAPEPPSEPGPARLWLFPIVAIVLGLIVAVWSIWNVLD